MREPGLKEYYEQELRFLRELGAQFGREHEEIAAALRMEPSRCDDPHVERLLEGFAFLAARVHRRIDDDFSEICQALLNTVYPQYLRPIPSMSVVQLHPDPGVSVEGYEVPAGSSLVAPLAEGVRCRFRTCYDTKITPLRTGDVAWQSPHGLDLGTGARDVAACLRLTLNSVGGHAIGEIPLEQLRVYLEGDLSLTTDIYELLDNSCVNVVVRDPEGPVPDLSLGAGAVKPVGFAESEGMMAYPGRSFLGHRYLLEYFAFPYKYLFFDIEGLSRLRGKPYGESIELLFLIQQFERAERQGILERSVGRDNIRLGCTPIVNLFEQDGVPVRLDHRFAEYIVRGGGPEEHPYDVFAVDDAWAVTGSAERVRFSPFFSYGHRDRSSGSGMFWYSRRRPRSWRDDGSTDVSVAFVDRRGMTIKPDLPSILTRVQCFNGGLPSRLPMGRARGDLEPEGGGGAPVERIEILMHATKPIQPPLDGSLMWRLVSQFSLNYLSLTDDDGSALRELLKVYNLGDFEAASKLIRGVAGVRSEPHYARVQSDHGLSFARGQRIHVDFQEEVYSAGGIYLLASVLERFFGLYATMNSFTAMTATVQSRHRSYTLREWNPRAGLRTWI